MQWHLYFVRLSFLCGGIKHKDMKCNVCGIQFNEADLSEVVKHEHNGMVAEKTIGKKVIKHASEVYPHCSGQFAGGVHSFLSGDGYPKYPDPKEFMQGYWCAERDLGDNYVLDY